MPTMTIAQVYGPWSGTADTWATSTGTWADGAGSWDDTAITWAEALQPWAVSFAGTAARLFEVRQEVRITNIDFDARIIGVEPEG